MIEGARAAPRIWAIENNRKQSGSRNDLAKARENQCD